MKSGLLIITGESSQRRSLPTARVTLDEAKATLQLVHRHESLHLWNIPNLELSEIDLGFFLLFGIDIVEICAVYPKYAIEDVRPRNRGS